ncbi:MAG: glycoside hydrolase family 57 protein, partial [Candidatus Atribacteria bacterium]|nr:glycoside hydrolase family 57 protein [Candidatus Atribacteria bacterium]
APSSTLTDRFPRFLELRSRVDAGDHLDGQEWRDIQVLYQLLWFDPLTIEENEGIYRLIRKGRSFSEEEKEILWSTTSTMFQNIPAAYQDLSHRGQVELSTSPFYHPILPLLIDGQVARESDPSILLSSHCFRHKDDAQTHIQRARDYSQAYWGETVHGMWPSEGSVSDEALSLMAENGVDWAMSGEEVLFHSLGYSPDRNEDGVVQNGERLYHPALFLTPGKRISVFFRDRFLSDLIGFSYQHYDAQQAVDDFIRRLQLLRSSLPVDSHPVVTVVLDGENSWEYYPDNGYHFLTRLYDAISQKPDIIPMTPSEYLKQFPDQPILTHVVAGSWIYGRLNTWIGHPEKNWAWDQLFRVRDLVDRKAIALSRELKEKVFDILYQSEGSDWFWWMGDDNPTPQKREFQEHFVSLLKRICDLIGEEFPRLEWPGR